MRGSELRTSRSDLETYLDCPRKWYYNHHPEIPKKTDYPRLCGGEVHHHIAWFYHPTLEPRPFYYKNKKSAIGTWFKRWERALEKATREEKLILVNEKLAKEYGRIGVYCINNYWNANVNLPRPLEVEGCYKAYLGSGVIFVGRFDQVREVSLDWVRTHRPEIVENGRLLPGFDNKVIVDLKTDYLDFDPHRLREDPSLEEQIRLQYELHEDLQATTYTFLYEQKTGKKPIGFLWYHLRSGKMFFTYREDRDYQTLYGVIHHFLDNISTESFPKHVGRHCRFCDYLEPCREDRYFLVVEPEELTEDSLVPRIVPNLIIKDPHRQLKFKWKMSRKKQKKLVVTSKKKTIVLRNLPWDEEERILSR